jgi:accessory gene regulator protein AgrB
MQKGILILWVVSFIRMLFNFLMLIYIGEFVNYVFMDVWIYCPAPIEAQPPCFRVYGRAGGEGGLQI